jgi:hypothetical protein
MASRTPRGMDRNLGPQAGAATWPQQGAMTPSP